MRISKRFIMLAASLLLLIMGTAHTAGAQSHEVQIVTIQANGPVTPAMAGYISRGIEVADARNAELLLIELDTPGGGVQTTLNVVQAIRASDVPVAVYVTPNGATAGSAGLLITLAGHASAMAPETAIGASSPVGPNGSELEPTLALKQKEIVAAEARSLAERRGESAVVLANDAVFDARAASATEAAEANLVDFVSADRAELLTQLEGLEVMVQGDIRTLDTLGATMTELPPTIIEQVLMLIVNPNIVVALFLIGIAGIIAEIASPGGWAAGAVGVACLGMALYGFGVLPINGLGVVFIVMALVLFGLEMAAAGVGVLAAAGVASLTVGLMITFGSPTFAGYEQLSIPLLITLMLVLSAMVGLYVRMIIRVRQRPTKTGQEGLIGKEARVIKPLTPTGTVFVQGERWQASLEEDEQAGRGERVIIVAVEGMSLTVQRGEKSVVS
jgi:membrane-bound serine protease (ClpP class)